MPDKLDMVDRLLLEQIELLKSHMEQDLPSAEFIERHAFTIIELAKSLPSMDRRLPRMQVISSVDRRAFGA